MSKSSQNSVFPIESLSQILIERLKAENIQGSFLKGNIYTTLSDGKIVRILDTTTLLPALEKEFSSNETDPKMLNEDSSSAATAFFLRADEAFVIPRSFLVSEALSDDFMSDVVEVITFASPETLPKTIAFVYGTSGHFMSVVIDLTKRKIRFADSLGKSENSPSYQKFQKLANLKLVPSLQQKFPGQEFSFNEVKYENKLMQSDLTTCNFNCMVNSLIGVWRYNGRTPEEIAKKLSDIFGIQIQLSDVAHIKNLSPQEQIQDLLRQYSEYLNAADIAKSGAAPDVVFKESNLRKVVVQRRMLTAAAIYYNVADSIYQPSLHNQQFQKIAGKDNNLLDKFTKILFSNIKYGSEASQKLLEIMIKRGWSDKVLILNNNFALNPHLRLGCGDQKQDLRNFIFNVDNIIKFLSGDQVSDSQKELLLTVFNNVKVLFDEYLESPNAELRFEIIDSALRELAKASSEQKGEITNESTSGFEDSKYLLAKEVERITGFKRKFPEGGFDNEQKEFFMAILASIPTDADIEGFLYQKYGDNDEYNILHIAAICNYESEFFRKFVNYNQEFVNQSDPQGNKCLHLLLINHNFNLENVKALIEIGIDINSINGNGDTPLNIALRNGAPVEFIEGLLNCGANANFNNCHNIIGNQVSQDEQIIYQTTLGAALYRLIGNADADDKINSLKSISIILEKGNISMSDFYLVFIFKAVDDIEKMLSEEGKNICNNIVDHLIKFNPYLIHQMVSDKLLDKTNSQSNNQAPALLDDSRVTIKDLLIGIVLDISPEIVGTVLENGVQAGLNIATIDSRQKIIGQIINKLGVDNLSASAQIKYLECIIAILESDHFSFDSNPDLLVFLNEMIQGSQDQIGQSASDFGILPEFISKVSHSLEKFNNPQAQHPRTSVAISDASTLNQPEEQEKKEDKGNGR